MGVLWKEIEVIESGTFKGKVVRARENLPEGLCIPYGGIFRSRQEAINIAKHNNRGAERRNSHGAAFEITGENGRKEYCMVDAHPTIMQDRDIPYGAWPGAFCNQADLPQQVNAELFQHDGECRVPHYEYMDTRVRTLFVRTLRAISAGEEILIDYAYSAVRQTRWGFGPRAQKRESEVVYTLRQRDPKRVKYGVEQQIE